MRHPCPNIPGRQGLGVLEEGTILTITRLALRLPANDFAGAVARPLGTHGKHHGPPWRRDQSPFFAGGRVPVERKRSVKRRTVAICGNRHSVLCTASVARAALRFARSCTLIVCSRVQGSGLRRRVPEGPLARQYGRAARSPNCEDVKMAMSASH